MELLEVILDEVRNVRTELKEHMRDEDKNLHAIREDVQALSTQAQLNKQQGNAIVAAISLVVSAVVAWLVTYLGSK